MKKMLLLTLVLMFSIASGAWAAQVTITFDESFVNPGGSNRYDGTQILNQYATAPWGATFTDTNSNSQYAGQNVCAPGEFSGANWGNDNYLFVYGGYAGSGVNPATALITLSTPSNYFSIEYRRPQAAGTFVFDLYLDSTLVYKGDTLTWDPLLNGGTWTTFTAPSVLFNKIDISINDKSSFDNLTINPVPVPPSLLLLVGGLGSLGIIRKRFIKH
jgi:hypothetical protein